MIDKHLLWSDGLYREIVVDDCYRLKQLQFVPDTVYDIGANLGAFTLFAKSLWPDTKVVAVEPHLTNFEKLSEVCYGVSRSTLINAALGSGEVHWIEANGGESNPGGQIYASKCVGYNDEDLAKIPKAGCESIALSQLFNKHPPSGPYVVKIDTEGAEETLFDDVESTEVLRNAAYWAAELHFYSRHYRVAPRIGANSYGLLTTHGHVVRACMDWCYGFSETHKVNIELTFPNAGMIWCSLKEHS